jgi:DNA repair exonuclease SbcCD ATPase subunit|tara:strand:- start:10099 stop:12423 length:2325 start_codon:yes stop_codon:yes gene_type:complete
MSSVKYDNPSIKVVWEDTPENFTNERLARVKSYFKKKYSTRKVNVITKVTETEDSKGSLDVGDKILDAVYQDRLVKDFLMEQDVVVDWDKLKRLDNRVEEKLLEESPNEISNKKWAVKWIEFSNFLSFGEDNRIDFNDLGGITAIDSIPSNFGGKTTLSVDLLLFLFFNKTTKSSKAIEVFNKFTNKNRVLVRGEVEMDGSSYVIERGIIRKKTKKGDWNVKTELNFSKVLDDNTLQNLQGEQRRETESIITKSIGSVDDFLLTIVTTGSNLEELIDTKPTQRGDILTRFIGLERIKEKEVICKKMYSDWSKKLVSNLYNITDLNDSTNTLKEEVKTNNETIIELNVKINEKDSEIKSVSDERDKASEKKVTNINSSIVNMDPKELEREIGRIIKEKNYLVNNFDDTDIIEPNIQYNEELHSNTSEKINENNIDLRLLGKDITDTEKFIKELEESEMCPTCNRPLDDVNHKDEIDNKLKILNKNKTKLIKDTNKNEKLVNQEKTFSLCKSDWRTYERRKLDRIKHELQIKDVDIRLKEKEGEMELWNTNESRVDENRKMNELMVSLKTRISTLQAIRDRHLTNIKTLESTNKYNEVNIIENDDKVTKINSEEEIGRVFKSYLISYGKNGISKIILKNTIPHINSELNRLLSDSALFIVVLKITDKNELGFFMIDNETSIEKPLSSGSGYEKTIASLALRAVLANVCSLPKPNIVCFDEVFGKVSDENLELIGNFFVKIKDYFDNIFVITHNSLVKEWSDNNITVTKTGNVSKIK